MANISKVPGFQNVRNTDELSIFYNEKTIVMFNDFMRIIWHKK